MLTFTLSIDISTTLSGTSGTAVSLLRFTDLCTDFEFVSEDLHLGGSATLLGGHLFTEFLGPSHTLLSTTSTALPDPLSIQVGGIFETTLSVGLASGSIDFSTFPPFDELTTGMLEFSMLFTFQESTITGEIWASLDLAGTDLTVAATAENRPFSLARNAC